MPKLAALLALYFAQGLPFGFQATALPLLLRERGVSLQAIGLSGLLATPWMVKALWAPWVDRYGSARLGRRKSWIIPMQAGLCACALLAARIDSQLGLLAVILVMNLLAATQDIAVDGLAVSWLDERELGPGNAIQVVGYKLGMLTGGGLLVWASAIWSWSLLFHIMAGLLALVLLISLAIREQPSASSGQAGGLGFGQIVAALRRALRDRATAALVLIILTYKMGETLANAMWKPMLFDLGFPSASIGLWTGTFGMICSLLGSFGSGMLVQRIAAQRALLWTAALRALGVGAQYWLSLQTHPSASSVVAVTCLEHLFGGAITTVMFAIMMRHTDREIGATHYTLLASLEVWGKVPLSALSGVIAASLGYPALYALATLLCLGFSWLVIALRPRMAGAPIAALPS